MLSYYTSIRKEKGPTQYTNTQAKEKAIGQWNAMFTSLVPRPLEDPNTEGLGMRLHVHLVCEWNLFTSKRAFLAQFKSESTKLTVSHHWRRVEPFYHCLHMYILGCSFSLSIGVKSYHGRNTWPRFGFASCWKSWGPPSPNIFTTRTLMAPTLFGTLSETRGSLLHTKCVVCGRV